MRNVQTLHSKCVNTAAMRGNMAIIELCNILNWTVQCNVNLDFLIFDFYQIYILTQELLKVPSLNASK